MKKMISVFMFLLLMSFVIIAGGLNIKSFTKAQTSGETPSFITTESSESKFLINLFLDKSSCGVYGEGESIEISVKSEKDCYIYLFGINPKGNAWIVFPTYDVQDNFVHAGKLKELKPTETGSYMADGTGMLILFLVAVQKKDILFNSDPGISYRGRFTSKESFQNYYYLTGNCSKPSDFVCSVYNILLAYPAHTWSMVTDIFFISGTHIDTSHEEIILNETFLMTDGKQKFEREIDSKTKFMIKSFWTLQSKITEVHAAVKKTGQSQEKIMSLNFTMGAVPYPEQKFIKTIDGIKYTVTILNFEWVNGDKSTRTMKQIRFRIVAKRIK